MRIGCGRGGGGGVGAGGAGTQDTTGTNDGGWGSVSWTIYDVFLG